MADGPLIQEECNICCEKFNNSIRSRIECQYVDCQYQACKCCVRQYLLSTVENPHCMNCKKAWSQNFIVMYLNRSFITKDYTTHRSNLLLEREISKLPETMDAVDKYIKCENEEKKISELNEKINQLRIEQLKLQEEITICNRNINNIKNNNNIVEKKKFILKCPNEDCRGYLSTHYKCDLCKLYTCKNCIEVIGYNKEDNHECNEDSIKTAELIKKDTKPCPSCGVRIYKIDGCDQMWCTECHIAFSWKTGQIDNIGKIHNPHYYEYQRSINNGVIPRDPQDVICGGDVGLIGWPLLQRILRAINNISIHRYQNLKIQISNIHRLINHIFGNELTIIRRNLRYFDNDSEKLRILYIIKKKTKEELKKQLYKNDNKKRKLTELSHIYEILHDVGVDMFNQFIHKDNFYKPIKQYIELLETKINEYKNLCIYCNEQLKMISISYNTSVIHIDVNNNYDFQKEKYSLSQIQKNM